jgi:hypothetical protein
MDTFLRLLISLGFVAMAVGLPAKALADIWVTITDGTVVHAPGSYQPGFATTISTNQGQTTTMALFPVPSTVCTVRPCQVPFSTFQFRDACGKNGTTTEPKLPRCPLGALDQDSLGAARITKYEDPSNLRVVLKGLQITAQPNLTTRQVTVSYGTDKGEDFQSVPAGDFPWTVTLSGTFTKRPPQSQLGSGDLTGSCPDPGTNPSTDTACARLELWINAVTVNSTRPPQIRTVSIPCSNSYGTNPCGPGKSYQKTAGAFTSELSGLRRFDEPVIPYLRMDLTGVNFTLKEQTFASMSSAVIAMSRVTVDKLGVENLFYSLADERGGDYWVYFSPVSNSFFPDEDGVTLTSIWLDKATKLDQARNSRSYASFIAKPLQHRWGDVKKLRFVYEVIAGSSDSGYPEPAKLVFSDCIDGSFYVLVNLVKRGDKDEEQDAEKLKIYLGSVEKNFLSVCGQATKHLSGFNLVKNDELRVDGKMTVKESQKQYGDRYVRSISMVVEQVAAGPANFKVRLYDARVGDDKLAISPQEEPSELRQFADLPDSPIAKQDRSERLAKASSAPIKRISEVVAEGLTPGAQRAR